MIRKAFIAGLIILLPIAITYTIFVWIVHLITRPFHEFVHSILLEYQIIERGFLHLSTHQATDIIAKILICVTIIAFVFILGVVSHYFLLRFLVYISDSVVGKLPFIGKIYRSCKDFTNIVFSTKQSNFSQVVLVPYPSKDHRAIGLISGVFKNEAIAHDDKEMVSVLIPGTPNPTIGFVLIFPKSDITFIDMNVSEAIRFVISGGTINKKGSIL